VKSWKTEEKKSFSRFFFFFFEANSNALSSVGHASNYQHQSLLVTSLLWIYLMSINNSVNVDGVVAQFQINSQTWYIQTVWSSNADSFSLRVSNSTTRGSC
jgi:hypothetical protein